MFIVKNIQENATGSLECEILRGESWFDFTMSSSDDYEIHISSDWLDIKPCNQLIKDAHQLGQLQQEAVSAMSSAVIAECRSGTGKLYFSDLNSAARHANELIQPDAEIRDRATRLLSWDIAIDAYALDVVFSIEQGGEVPTLEAFIAGLPTI